MEKKKIIIWNRKNPIKYEISQQDNWNATTRLFVLDDGTVFKKYVVKNEISKKNIQNLLALCQKKELYQIPEIAMPIKIEKTIFGVKGYTMPLCHGIPMEEFLMDESKSVKAQLQSLINLGKVILKLPKDVYIGDLHGRNVLVEEDGTIHLIDIDGFSLKNNMISCPIKYAGFRYDICTLHKYFFRDNTLIISKQTDIFCFYILFLLWISQENMLMYSKTEILGYIDYLDKLGLPENFIKSIRKIFTEENNTIISDTIYKKIAQEFNLNKLNYKVYLKQNNALMLKEETKLSLRDRVESLDPDGTTFDYEKANSYCDKLVAATIKEVEGNINTGNYQKVSTGIFHRETYKCVSGVVRGGAICVKSNFHSPKESGYITCYGIFMYVRNRDEEKYINNRILSQLEKEGFQCYRGYGHNTHRKESFDTIRYDFRW